MRSRGFFVLLLTLVLIASALPGAVAAEPIADHVLIIGLDGARPEILQVPGLRNIADLIASGTVIWNAQAVEPTITEVNWAAMLSGSKPEKTGITKKFDSEADLEGFRIGATTIFEVVAQHGKSAAGYLGHWKLYTLDTKTPGPFIMRSPYSSTQAARSASLRLQVEKSNLTFVYMGDLDGHGHNYGWLSDQQVAAMPTIDAAIGQLLMAVDKGGFRDRTIVMIVSDHGGTDKRHTQGTITDSTVPWVISGPGVCQGCVIDNSAVRPYDIAATALYALGIPIPAEWDGQPVLEVFE